MANLKDWLTLTWVNQSAQRYYKALLQQNLFDDWQLALCWGSLSSRQGGGKEIYCETYQEALSLLAQTKKSAANSAVIP